jgi:hypothetical protein
MSLLPPKIPAHYVFSRLVGFIDFSRSRLVPAMTTTTSVAALKSLSFSEYIQMLPTEWVFDHFLKKGTTRRRILSSSAVTEHIRVFSTSDALLRQFSSLSPELRLTCCLAYLMGETGIAGAQDDCDLNDPILQSFLVFAGRKNNGKARYFGFNEFEPILRSVMAKELAGYALRKNRPEQHPVPSVHVLNDVVMIVTLAGQGLLQKKKQGGFMRNTVQKIAKLIHEYPGEPERLADLLIQCGVSSGLLAPNDQGFSCVSSSCDTWLERQADQRMEECIGTAIRCAGALRIPLLRESLLVARGAWFSLSLFAEEERKAVGDILGMLSWAGIVECVREGSDFLFGIPGDTGLLDENGKHFTSVTIMPDFSAVISQNVEPVNLYRFGKCGTLHSLDRVYKGVIDRGVLCDSLAGGLDGELLVRWLVEWQAPSNVVVTVREWIREFNRLYVTGHAMLVSCDAKVSHQIDAYSPLAGLVEKVPAQVVYRIKKGNEAQVKEILNGMGFDHRMPCLETPCEEARLAPPAKEPAGGWEPVINEKNESEPESIAMRGKKYGAGLKTFDMNETIHVIDYANLTGQEIVFDYGGSPLVKKGRYTVAPQACSRGAEPLVETTDGQGRKRKFLVSKIIRIGVGRS